MMMKKLGLLLSFTMVLVMYNNVLAETTLNTSEKPSVALEQPKKRFLEFNEVKELCRTLSAKLDQQKWTGIIVVTRGGLTPAALISQLLPNRDIRTICLKSYDEDKKQKKVELLYDPKLPNQGEGYLFIDEISDTGNTFNTLKKLYPKAKFVTLYAKPQGKGSADYVGEEVPQDQWIVFPWEYE